MIAVACMCLLGIGYLTYLYFADRASLSGSGAQQTVRSADGQLITETKPDGRAIVKDSTGTVLATFTNGARTVVMPGPSRTFSEPASTSATITTTDWVRIYPQAFSGTVDSAWLTRAAAQNAAGEPDILAISMQYVKGSAQLKDAQGTIYAGDASFGPGTGDGDRQEGSDFNDFMGTRHVYGSVTDKPERGQLGSLDCSGFQRMVWGYRGGLPMELEPTGTAIPRRAYQMLASAPGTTLAPDTGTPLSGIPASLQTGDILFFDVQGDDGARVDHMGLFLGVDSEGNHRFISSRKVADGPTMGDIAGRSIIDGTGFFAKSFRAVRRF